MAIEDVAARTEDRRHAQGRVRRSLAGLGRRIADVIVPPLCLSCHAPLASHDAVCARCWNDVTFIRAPLCDRLGLPLPYGGEGIQISAAAAADPPVYDRARAVAAFDGVMRDLIHGFKYSDRQEPRRLMARWMVSAGAELLADADMLVPVPLTRWRLIRRQFNQSALLAKEVGRLSRVAFAPDLLARVRTTRSQVGLSLEARRRNVAGAFAVPRRKAERLRGMRVLLVDDVITTGATVSACARALKAAGAARVDVLALAIVVDARQVQP